MVYYGIFIPNIIFLERIDILCQKSKNLRRSTPNITTAIYVGGAIVVTALITKKINMDILAKNKLLVRTDCNNYCMPLGDFKPLAAAKSCVEGIWEGTFVNGKLVRGYCDCGKCLPEGVETITLGGLKEAIDEIVTEGLATDKSKIDVAMFAWYED